MSDFFSTSRDKKNSLDIIIPTYNRAKFLKKNIILLLEFIEKVDDLIINILVSNNCSSDNTKNILSDLACDRLICFHQEENIGGVNNVLFLLEKSKSDYVMTLGDDDYIPSDYLNKVSYAIRNYSPGVIFGNCEHVNDLGNKLGFIRDINPGKDVEMLKPNIYNKLKFNNHASQISGLVFFRDGLYEKFVQSRAFNLYPQISFFLISTKGKPIVYLRSSLISITQVVQSKKDWSYGSDCLLDDKFNNYKCHFSNSYFSRVVFEARILTEPSISFVNQLLSYPWLFYKSVLIGKNWTLINKIFFPIYIFVGVIRGLTNRLRKFFKRTMSK